MGLALFILGCCFPPVPRPFQAVGLPLPARFRRSRLPLAGRPASCPDHGSRGSVTSLPPAFRRRGVRTPSRFPHQNQERSPGVCVWPRARPGTARWLPGGTTSHQRRGRGVLRGRARTPDSFVPLSPLQGRTANGREASTRQGTFVTAKSKDRSKPCACPTRRPTASLRDRT